MSGRYPGYFQDISRKNPGNFQEISRESFQDMSFKFPRNFGKKTGSRKFLGHFLEISWIFPQFFSREFPENFVEIFRMISRFFFRKISQKISGNVRKCSGFVQEISNSQKFLRNISGHFPEFSRKFLRKFLREFASRA